jgi:hypothetical protein
MKQPWLWIGLGLMVSCSDDDDAHDSAIADAAVVDASVDPTFPFDCTPTAPCGGELAGEWRWTDWCGGDTAWPHPVSESCGTFATVTTDIQPSGMIRFDEAGQYSATATYIEQRQTGVPLGCVDRCQDAIAVEFGAFRGGGGEGGGGGTDGEDAFAPARWVCAPGEDFCGCTSSTVLSDDSERWGVLEDVREGRWAADGSELTITNDGGVSRMLWFCARNDTLTLRYLNRGTGGEGGGASSYSNAPVFVLQRRN